MPNFSVPPQFDTLEQNVTVMAGRRAVITCEAEGDLPIRMHWYRGNSRNRVSNCNCNLFYIYIVDFDHKNI